MLNEIRPSGTTTYQPANEAEARQLLERTLPALITQTTYEVKRFFDALKKATLYVPPGATSIKLPTGAAECFRNSIGKIDQVREEENWNHGGVFIPYEGEPWNGFRLSNAAPHDMNRDLVSDHHIWEQMIGASQSLIRNMKPSGDGSSYQAFVRDIQSLFSIYSCPAAETWTPPTGFKYREVKNAMVEAAGGPAQEISAHVMQAITLIPESRIMPRISEVLSDAGLKTVSRRVAVHMALQETQATFDIPIEAPAPKPAPKAQREPFAPRVREMISQASLDL